MTSRAVVELEKVMEVRQLMNELLGAEGSERRELVREERFRSLALAERRGGPGGEGPGEGRPGSDGPDPPAAGDPRKALNRLFRCHEGPDVPKGEVDGTQHL